MSDPLIHLVTALPAEAKPIVGRFGLIRQQPDGGFPIYRKGRISLVISSPGKSNSAAATAFLHAMNACPKNAIWLNIGMTGHADKAIGSALLAHKIGDAGSGRHWRSSPTFALPCASDSLETLDKPDFTYSREGAFDMEASGFYATALRFAPAERVHCLKIVSDNRHQSGRGLSAADVRQLVSAHLDLIEHLLDQLENPAPGLTHRSSP